jgi:uncharacterized protein (TIGR00369 family)
MTGQPAGPEPLRATYQPPSVRVPLQEFLGISTSQRDDVIVGTMDVGDHSLNAAGNLHGGAIATLIDVTSGIAAARSGSYRPGENAIVTSDIHVRYLGRTTTASVRAEARVLRAGRQLVVVETRVLDGHDRLVATADFSSMVVPSRPPLDPGRPSDPRSPDL